MTVGAPWRYVRLGWVDEVTQAILPDLDRAVECIGAWGWEWAWW